MCQPESCRLAQVTYCLLAGQQPEINELREQVASLSGLAADLLVRVGTLESQVKKEFSGEVKPYV